MHIWGDIQRLMCVGFTSGHSTSGEHLLRIGIIRICIDPENVNENGQSWTYGIPRFLCVMFKTVSPVKIINTKIQPRLLNKILKHVCCVITNYIYFQTHHVHQWSIIIPPC